MIKQLIDFLRLNVETEQTMKSTRTLIYLVSLVLMVCSAVMSYLNYVNESWLMLSSTALLTAVFLVCFLICVIRYNQKAVEWVLGLAISSLFSFYAVIGGNAGFAIDWILLVPVAYMTLFGLTGGLLVGGYFWIFLIVCFWTPVSEFLPFLYPDETRLRFPLLYTCGFFLAIIIGVRNKRLQMAQFRSEEQLVKAVLAERSHVEQVSLDAVSSICHALDAKDNYTKEHSDHVAAYSCRIARRLGWEAPRIEQLKWAAQMHDLGKIGIPDAILKKNAALSDDEFATMKTHVILGAEIVADFTTMPGLVVGAKYHHERYDGSGYCTGLAGEAIPIEGRIIGLADAIDAMSSDRVYRKKRSREFLLGELERGSGTQFDPRLVRVATGLIEEGMIEQVNTLYPSR